MHIALLFNDRVIVVHRDKLKRCLGDVPITWLVAVPANITPASPDVEHDESRQTVEPDVVRQPLPRERRRRRRSNRTVDGSYDGVPSRPKAGHTSTGAPKQLRVFLPSHGAWT